MQRLKTSFLFILLCINTDLLSQNSNLISQKYSNKLITSSFPLMTIAPDARSAGMGDIGAATTPDINSAYWNVGKLALFDKDMAFGLSYTPWNPEGFKVIQIYNFVSVIRLKQRHTLGLSTSVFNMVREDSIGSIDILKPREYYISVNYAYKLRPNMGLGLSLKYIHANVENYYSSITDTNADHTLAIDLGWYWNIDLNQNSDLAFGASINNFGNKIQYFPDDIHYPIPTNLRIGSSYTRQINDAHSLSFSLDFHKLLVPSPPEYAFDINGNMLIDEDGNPVIIKGKDPNRPLLSSIIGSFNDAPGGLDEEFQEIVGGFGIEYWYKNVVAFRSGYSWEHINKGNRKYFTFGIGLNYRKIGMDISYLLPQYDNQPLKETLRFSVSLLFGKANKE